MRYGIVRPFFACADMAHVPSRSDRTSGDSGSTLPLPTRVSGGGAGVSGSPATDRRERGRPSRG